MKAIIILVIILSSCNHEKCYEDYQKANGISKIKLDTPNGEMEIPYTIDESNKLIIDGDIILDSNYSASKALTFRYGYEYWKDGIIHYYFDEDISDSAKSSFVNAAAVWTELTDGVIKFIEIQAIPEDNNYLLITKGDVNNACFASVGYRHYDTNRIWLTASGYCSPQVLVHEIGHVLGLFHEHQRPDRDDFIEVQWCNIDKNYYYAYEKRSVLNTISPTDYDINSIMHYNSYGFSTFGLPTFVIKDDPAAIIFNKFKPSELDIQAILEIYAPK